MKQHIDLTISGASPGDTLTTITQGLTCGWSRDVDSEAELLKLHVVGFVFSHKDKGTLVLRDSGGTLGVSTVRLASGCKGLDGDEDTDACNSVIREFCSDVLEPLKVQGLLSFQMSSDSSDPVVVFGHEVGLLFNSFAHCSNKESGGVNQTDRERLFDFVIGAHESRKPVDAMQLHQLLIECGWSEKYAHDVSNHVELLLGLLRHRDPE